AADLVEGQPCPVCGSTSHPHCAVLPENTPEKADVERARAEEEAARDAADEASTAAAELRSALAQQEEQLTKDCTAHDLVFGEDTRAAVKARVEENRALRESLKAQGETLERNANRLEELNKTLPELQKAGEDRAAALTELTRTVAGLEGQRESRETELREAQEKLPFASLQQADEALAGLEQKQTALETALREAREAFDKAKNSKLTLETRQESLTGELEGFDKAAAEARVKRIAELTEQGKALEQNVIALTGTLSAGQTALEDARKTLEALAAAREKQRWLAELDSVFNGKLTSEGKLKLDTYVQAIYFDQVLALANRRLYAMTGGQYELARQMEAGDKRSGYALNLDVIDHYGDVSRRSVKTLSGGESFLAALALALGLSDLIQERAGGVQLDTLFVDEGFGSLDAESLEKALRTLEELGQENRLVGIISHVEELQQRIDRKIDVRKQASGGSTATLIV
ncbi:MAG: hypothetical protein J5847_05325, partial [Clostridia bacterium]|nr:hypothetical protein [Clostridia bacterium]